METGNGKIMWASENETRRGTGDKTKDPNPLFLVSKNGSFIKERARAQNELFSTKRAEIKRAEKRREGQ